MNDALFEQLLYEEEGPVLDFKKEQYRFSKATEDEKSELLKDILGFANAWRRSDAYVLIGVEDVRGGRANVIGIADHLDDHALQQFVNNLTNRPVRFHYEAFGCEGKQVGIIRIDEQTRPIYLKRDFGKLKRNEVYVRRGSSTDPTKPATPEEISQMGAGPAPRLAELVVGFSDVARDTSLGTHIAWEAEYCEMPSEKTIPHLMDRTDSVGGVAWPRFDLTHHANPYYYRDLARYEFASRLFRPVRLMVTNGPVAANSVRIELTVPTAGGTRMMYWSDRPELPKRDSNRLGFHTLSPVRSVSRQSPGDVVIDRNDERIRVEIDCGNLQPGRRMWSEVFFLGITTSGETALRGRVLCDNLPAPSDFTLTISATITRSRMTVEELKALGRPSRPAQ